MAVGKHLTPREPAEPRPVVWIGSAKRDLDDLSEDLKDAFGYALDLAERGGMSPDAKPMKGHLRDVTEIVVDEGTDTYRAAYTVRLRGVVYVLHVFKKKSKSGRATPKADIDLIEQRYKAAKRHYEMYVRPEGE